MTTLAETDISETMEDLLHRLGDIAPSRVRMHPTPGTATEEDVLAIDAREGRLFELVDGVLVEKGMGYRESLIAIAISHALESWVGPRRLGLVTGEGGMMRIVLKQVRIPDVAYISAARLPSGKPPSNAVPAISPDLAVEVLSESNTKAEMARKRVEYFAGGTGVVWEVDPDTRSVGVHTGPDSFTTLRDDDVLSGGTVLPGFELPLRVVFAKLDFGVT